ncbi:MAG: type II toxin-antitoxin system PemK/MazF family toxin [Clostridia bacterium]|nr:type II toxin-antitoxin system PemK/MazF family toxin [Clostridia bacterium]
MAEYRPEQGDLVMMNFSPQAGHEQAGRRPALVISNASFHRYTRMAIVCPITSQIKDYPMHVKLDARTKTTGEILCEHVKSLDLSARKATFVEALPNDLLQEVLERVRMSIE